MKVIVEKNARHLGIAAGKAAAALIAAAIQEKGQANIILGTGASQFETLRQLTASKDIEWNKVVMFHLDEYIGLKGNPRITFIKCDCEGHEMAVFKGAESLLRRDHPVLLFECEQRHLPKSSPAAIFNYLQGLGYRGWFFGASGLTPVEQFRPETHQPLRPGRFWDAKDYYNNFAFLSETR